MIVQQYLIKADMREGKYAYIKENANAKRQIYAKAGAMPVWKTIKGEL